ncbi:Uma2 family endonuclease [candidate division KSB1 bacterium]|nr:Uma2 family endonuclease [candidate division KSB1 bacterium]
MSALPKKFYSPQEYLELERAAEYKSQYYAGEIFAMSGGSPRHNLISTNVIGELRTQLKGRPCGVYPSDQRLKIPATGLYTYPDVSVVCGEAQFDDEDLLLNPVLLVEILSDSTEAFDRGKKFEHYRKIPTLREFLLIAQDRCKIDQHVKQEDGRWVLLSEVSDMQSSIKLPSLNCELAVAEIYYEVKFE